MRKLLLFGFLMLTSVSAAQAQTLADYDYENLTFRGFGFGSHIYGGRSSGRGHARRRYG